MAGWLFYMLFILLPWGIGVWTMICWSWDGIVDYYNRKDGDDE